jgi:hypothetical protein
MKYCDLQVMDMAASSEGTRALTNFGITENRLQKKPVTYLFFLFPKYKEDFWRLENKISTE